MEGDKIIDSFNKLLKFSSVWSSDYTKARKLINEMDGNSKDGKKLLKANTKGLLKRNKQKKAKRRLKISLL